MRTSANSLNMKGLTALDHCPRDFVALQLKSHQPPNRWKKWENFWSKYLQYQGNWIKETRGTLMVVATVIATMTFQSALNPPGGVWQENTKMVGTLALSTVFVKQEPQLLVMNGQKTM
ncbi:PGG domain [Sesbania bispinosa]|nr:PGG domain [Sesbania bispinosa]